MSSDTFGRVESKVGSSEQCAIDGDLPINRYQEDLECRKEKKNILSPLHTGSSVFLDTFCSYETTQFCFKENRNCVSVKKHYKYEISGRSQKCFQKTKSCKLSVIKIIIMRNLSMHRQLSQMFSPEMFLLNM